MKAIVQTRYGLPDVLELQEVDKPVPEVDQVLVRVHAASVNQYDWHFLTGTPYLLRLGGGLSKPKQVIPGVDFAGEVEAVGANVTRFQPGDEVYGMRSGAFAEYLCVREPRLARKPANASFAEAAAVPMAGLSALQGLRDKGGIRAGQRVLIIGASGGVGTYAVQLAKVFGAEVTAVCSPGNVAAARSLGADRVIDYTCEDLVQCGQKFDLILDVPGNRSLADRKRVLTPRGIAVCVGGPKTNRWIGPMGQMPGMMLVSWFGNQKFVSMLTQHSVDDLDHMRELMEAGKVRSVVAKTYPLAQTAEALRHVGTGHAQGKIVITVP